MNEVWVHRYVLRSRGDLNAAGADAEHEGALLRLGEGVGCLHPWVALGDAPLDEQLSALCAGEGTQQAERALECAVVDGRARAQGKSVFETLSIPESHALVGSMEDFERKREAGFGVFKVKCGRDLGAEGAMIGEMAEAGGVKLRLDFNERVDAAAFAGFWEGLPTGVRMAVEFVEDPCPYGGEVWAELGEETGARLAVDRAVERAGEGGADVLVVKPAVDRVHDVMSLAEALDKPVVFTSYLDHPIGQMFAALEASLAKWAWPERVGVCGLVTHEWFEGDVFCDAVKADGARLLAPEGTGLGFDDLLGTLEWERLI
ncbi:MAG: enolase C-terminal domain-like protein [Verrucomicrobiota bacterium]